MLARGDGHTDKAAGLAGKKVDNFWRNFLSSDHEVSLVFSVLIIHEDDHLTFAYVVQYVWNGIEGHLNSPGLALIFTSFYDLAFSTSQSLRQLLHHRLCKAPRHHAVCRNDALRALA